MQEHTVRAFDADLEGLRRGISEMGGIAEKMLADATAALVERDAALAQSVIAADGRLDILQGDIEERAILTIARRQPLAVDLPYHPSDFVAFGPLDVIEGMSRDAGEARDGWDRDGSGGGWSGSRRAAAGAEQEAARRAGLADRHRLGRARRQPDGTRRRSAARRRAVGHALPVDQPAARQPAHRHRRRDGALCA